MIKWQNDPDSQDEKAPNQGEDNTFIKLVEFVKKEQKRKKLQSNPKHHAQISKLQQYENIKDLKDPQQNPQKGLQLNKAA